MARAPGRLRASIRPRPRKGAMRSPAAEGRRMWAQAAESAKGAGGWPCILHQPPSFRSQNWPDRFGLQSYLGPSPERWKGRVEAWSWGAGPVWTALSTWGVGAWAL